MLLQFSCIDADGKTDLLAAPSISSIPLPLSGRIVRVVAKCVNPATATISIKNNTKSIDKLVFQNENTKLKTYFNHQVKHLDEISVSVDEGKIEQLIVLILIALDDSEIL